MDKHSLSRFLEKSRSGNGILFLAVTAFALGLSYTAALLKKRLGFRGKP